LIASVHRWSFTRWSFTRWSPAGVLGKETDANRQGGDHGNALQAISLESHHEIVEQLWTTERTSFIHRESDQALSVLRFHGVTHGDNERRNMLCEGLYSPLIVIELEEVKWLKRPRV
jgi:hypothetical protein